MARDRSWMNRDKFYTEWQTGMNEFLGFSFDGADENTTVTCICRKCVNVLPQIRERCSP
jgi:hypothetical protein